MNSQDFNSGSQGLCIHRGIAGTHSDNGCTCLEHKELDIKKKKEKDVLVEGHMSTRAETFGKCYCISKTFGVCTSKSEEIRPSHVAVVKMIQIHHHLWD